MTRKLKKSYNYKVKTKEYIFKASNKWEQNKLWETKTFLCLSIKKRKKKTTLKILTTIISVIAKPFGKL